jgi:hypothetical protein
LVELDPDRDDGRLHLGDDVSESGGLLAMLLGRIGVSGDARNHTVVEDWSA